MKKLVLVAIMLLVPFTSFAIDTMSDSDLDEMTAQAGVTITLSNVTVGQEEAISAWGDSDGETDGKTSWIVQETTKSNKIYGGSVEIDVVQIDLDKDALTADVTAVQITLNALTITEKGDGTTTVISLQSGLTDSFVPTKSAASNNTLGTQYATNGTTTLGGQVLISAHE